MDARRITELLGGIWDGDRGMVPCSTFHPGPDPDPWSLSISNFETQVIFDLVRDGPGAGRPIYWGPLYDASEDDEVSGASKLPDLEGLEATLRDWITRTRQAEQHYEEARRRSDRAMAIWNEALPIQGTPAEAYLRQAGVPSRLSLPESLRYHPTCWHPSGAPRPAMVALLTGDLHRVFREDDPDPEEMQPFAMVHLTYLPQERSAEDADGRAEEFLLGEPGSAVEIVKQPLDAKTPILVAESIPSALALAAGILRLLPTPVRIWATLSPEGTQRLGLPAQMDPPWPGEGTVWRVQDPRWVVIASDGGDESRQAARELAQGARRFFRVDLLSAPEGQTWTEVWADMARKWGWGDWGCVSWTLEVTDRPTLGPDSDDLLQAAAAPGENEGTGQTVAPAEEARL